MFAKRKRTLEESISTWQEKTQQKKFFLRTSNVQQQIRESIEVGVKFSDGERLGVRTSVAVEATPTVRRCIGDALILSSAECLTASFNFFDGELAFDGNRVTAKRKTITVNMKFVASTFFGHVRGVLSQRERALHGLVGVLLKICGDACYLRSW